MLRPKRVPVIPGGTGQGHPEVLAGQVSTEHKQKQTTFQGERTVCLKVIACSVRGSEWKVQAETWTRTGLARRLALHLEETGLGLLRCLKQE